MTWGLGVGSPGVLRRSLACWLSSAEGVDTENASFPALIAGEVDLYRNVSSYIAT